MSKLTIVGERELQALVKFREDIFQILTEVAKEAESRCCGETKDNVRLIGWLHLCTRACEYQTQLKEWRNENENI